MIAGRKQKSFTQESERGGDGHVSPTFKIKEPEGGDTRDKEAKWRPGRRGEVRCSLKRSCKTDPKKLLSRGGGERPPQPPDLASWSKKKYTQKGVGTSRGECAAEVYLERSRWLRLCTVKDSIMGNRG